MSKPEISGNDIADEIEAGNRRHAAREAVVRRACKIMGWTYSTSPAYAVIRTVALGKAVAISVEKLHELLDRISPRPDRCEHGVSDGDWCEPCNRESKAAREQNEG